MELKDLIFTLCSQQGISGREYEITDKIAEILGKNESVYDIYRDKNNNLHASLGNPDGKTIMLDAHIDQIGFVVTKIDENGFLKVSRVGGMDMRVMNDTLFTVHGKEPIKAVVCCLPPHLSDGNEDTAVSEDKLWLDTGMSKERVESLIEIGDSITFAQECMELAGTKIAGPALDDRCCAALLIRCAEILKDKKLNCKIELLFSSKEEVGGMGAQTGSFIVQPDEAIAFDVSFAKQSGVSDASSGKLSKGPMIGYSPVLSREIYDKLICIAKENDISYQHEIMGGKTGTNADEISITAGGRKTGLISIPLRNMHTQAEIIDVEDIENTAQLVCKYILEK